MAKRGSEGMSEIVGPAGSREGDFSWGGSAGVVEDDELCWELDSAGWGLDGCCAKRAWQRRAEATAVLNKSLRNDMMNPA
jgi:hypothetical protein